MFNIYTCEAQIKFLLFFHPLPAESKQTILIKKIKLETGFFSLILTSWSQLWVVISLFSYIVDFWVNVTPVHVFFESWQ